jgi:hypothetical protein
MTATTTTFANVPTGATIRLESCIGVKQQPVMCEGAAKFYRGEVPGYPGKHDFHGWNFRYQFLGHGEFNFMSLSPETLVEVIA